MELKGRRVALLVENYYQDLEFWYPYYRMKEAGAEVKVIGTGAQSYKSQHGYEVKADMSAEEAKGEDFDAIIIPGGWAPDYLRRYDAVLRLVKEAYDAGKIVAAICHAGSVLVSAKILKGKRVTCVKAIKDDVINAGAHYLDEEVVRDRNLITSRLPADLPAFCREIISALAEKSVTEAVRQEVARGLTPP